MASTTRYDVWVAPAAGGSFSFLSGKVGKQAWKVADDVARDQKYNDHIIALVSTKKKRIWVFKAVGGQVPDSKSQQLTYDHEGAADLDQFLPTYLSTKLRPATEEKKIAVAVADAKAQLSDAKADVTATSTSASEAASVAATAAAALAPVANQLAIVVNNQQDISKPAAAEISTVVEDLKAVAASPSSTKADVKEALAVAETVVSSVQKALAGGFLFHVYVRDAGTWKSRPGTIKAASYDAVLDILLKQMDRKVEDARVDRVVIAQPNVSGTSGRQNGFKLHLVDVSQAAPQLLRTTTIRVATAPSLRYIIDFDQQRTTAKAPKPKTSRPKAPKAPKPKAPKPKAPRQKKSRPPSGRIPTASSRPKSRPKTTKTAAARVTIPANEERTVADWEKFLYGGTYLTNPRPRGTLTLDAFVAILRGPHGSTGRRSKYRLVQPGVLELLTKSRRRAASTARPKSKTKAPRPPRPASVPAKKPRAAPLTGEAAKLQDQLIKLGRQMSALFARGPKNYTKAQVDKLTDKMDLVEQRLDALIKRTRAKAPRPASKAPRAKAKAPRAKSKSKLVAASVASRRRRPALTAAITRIKIGRDIVLWDNALNDRGVRAQQSKGADVYRISIIPRNNISAAGAREVDTVLAKKGARNVPLKFIQWLQDPTTSRGWLADQYGRPAFVIVDEIVEVRPGGQTVHAINVYNAVARPFGRVNTRTRVARSDAGRRRVIAEVLALNRPGRPVRRRKTRTAGVATRSRSRSRSPSRASSLVSYTRSPSRSASRASYSTSTRARKPARARSRSRSPSYSKSFTASRSKGSVSRSYSASTLPRRSQRPTRRMGGFTDLTGQYCGVANAGARYRDRVGNRFVCKKDSTGEYTLQPTRKYSELGGRRQSGGAGIYASQYSERAEYAKDSYVKYKGRLYKA